MSGSLVTIDHSPFRARHQSVLRVAAHIGNTNDDPRQSFHGLFIQHVRQSSGDNINVPKGGNVSVRVCASPCRGAGEVCMLPPLPMFEPP